MYLRCTTRYLHTGICASGNGESRQRLLSHGSGFGLKLRSDFQAGSTDAGFPPDTGSLCSEAGPTLSISVFRVIKLLSMIAEEAALVKGAFYKIPGQARPEISQGAGSAWKVCFPVSLDTAI